MMAKLLVGRYKEKAILENLLAGNEPQLVAILGRRRVGKTYLILNYCNSRIAFECNGTIDGSTAVQLANFW